ncbi:hypothetical protein CR513_39604, partial [Mucuna pruriens]
MVVRLVMLEFSDYAIVWQNQVLAKIKRGRRYPCESWESSKRMMRERFVPFYYTRGPYNKLQTSYQSSKSVEEYHKQMEMDLIRAQAEEIMEVTMARFLHDLNNEIQDILVHQTIKVELQIKRRNVFRKPFSSSSSWKGKEREKERFRRDKSPKKGSDISQGQKETPSICTSSAPNFSCIMCFNSLDKGHITSKCPDRRTILLSDNGEVESESLYEESSFTSEAKSSSGGSHYEGDLQVVSNDGEVVFYHYRWGSSVNVASLRVVEKLAIPMSRKLSLSLSVEFLSPTFAHPKPCKLKWLNERGELLVDKQVVLAITLGNYEDRVVCDVVLMEATHILQLLEEFKDVFLNDVPHEMPPLRGIEHYINLSLGATLPNRVGYMTNP